MSKITYSKRLKRMPAPRLWPISRRIHKWVTKPSPGPHPVGECLPLVVVLRDILNVAQTGEEVEYLVSEGLIEVDGRRLSDKKRPLGLMDVLSLPRSHEYYRFLPTPRKGLMPHRIEPSEASLKLRKIIRKTVVKHGNVQLNFHDGTAYLLKVTDPRKPTEDLYKVGDSINFDINKGEMMDHVKLEPGNYVLITGGRNLGFHGRLNSYHGGTATSEASGTVEITGGESIQTTVTSIFAVGSMKPLVSLPRRVL